MVVHNWNCILGAFLVLPPGWWWFLLFVSTMNCKSYAWILIKLRVYSGRVCGKGESDRFRWRSRDETRFLLYNSCPKDDNNVLCFMSEGAFTTGWMFWNKGAFLLWARFFRHVQTQQSQCRCRTTEPRPPLLSDPNHGAVPLWQEQNWPSSRNK